MNADRAMTRAVFLCVGWAGLMLSLAEGRVFPVPLSLPIVVVAWFAYRADRMRCPTWLAAILGMGAFGAAFLEFAFGDIESRLLSIAHIIVYLTWIILFTRWRTREYWLLLALSLLQIAVGAVLTTEGWYGAMLVLSLILMLWTMSIFCFRNAHREYGQVAMVREGDRRGVRRKAAADPFRRFGATSGASQIDEGVSWLGGRFRRTLVKTLFATTMIAGVVFAAVPRVFIGNPFANVALEAGRKRAVALTGYTETVRLGEMGTVLESNEPVLRVRMFDVATDEVVSVEDFAQEQGMDEPMFRGTVMSNYKNGQWQRAKADNYVAIPLNQDDQYGRIRQEFSLQRTRARVLFVMAPYMSMTIHGERRQVRAARETGAIHYPRGRQYASRYTVISPIKVGGESRKDGRNRRRPRSLEFRPWPGYAKSWCGQVCRLMFQQVPEELTQLRALAATVGGTIEGLEPEPQIQAERIQDYLSDPDRFLYSLTAVQMDTSLDPVEDFLINHRTGNCEFFASAMTLMLRSQGIPARLVNGFKGGYTNDIDGTFEVQQMHAHTWVEAYINNEWKTFDPTPTARSVSVASMAPELKPLADLKMWLNELWSRFVLNVSLDEQKKRFYDPIKNQFQTFFRSISGRGKDGWRSAFSRRVWFSVPGFLVASLVLLAIAYRFRWRIGNLLQRVLGLFGWSGAKAVTAQREQRIVRFYERFREICDQHGQRRGPSQTEREFVVAMNSAWGERLRAAGLGDFPGWLVEQFYKVRFGETLPATIDESSIEQQLGKLEHMLGDVPGAA